jgi:hypothetical protein
MTQQEEALGLVAEVETLPTSGGGSADRQLFEGSRF